MAFQEFLQLILTPEQSRSKHLGFYCGKKDIKYEIRHRKHKQKATYLLATLTFCSSIIGLTPIINIFGATVLIICCRQKERNFSDINWQLSTRKIKQTEIFELEFLYLNRDTVQRTLTLYKTQRGVMYKVLAKCYFHPIVPGQVSKIVK